ncbi:glycosyltransferase family 4 protein [Catenulispora sp. NF23]|uniref:Glycosyltransferase family 4 protein n=1 Tax=Catenulispora pinistramenti TaxID=2705254 RepID=A0ABS5KSD7_9ACTN|nr:glycosyltransferase family 4 protein [Catenulispora pinistramenti]MBS2532693.1 glycosyltransferase family 4 protein [Catenulispora pinistramenti]MBS2548960.1 glycosyltransferase family 4 protein [Catenulispora pinistramenti]
MTQQSSPEHIPATGSAPGRRRHIVQVTPNYPPLLGGLEQVVQILATRLAARNDVSVVTTDNKADGAPHRAVEAGGVKVRRHRALTVAHTSLAPGMFGSLLRIRRGTVIHLHCATAVVPEQVWISARIRGLKYLLHFHMEVDASGPLGRLLPFYKTHLFGRVVRGAAGVIVLTESQRDFLAERYGVDPALVHVVPNGVAEEFFLPLRAPSTEPATGSSPDPLRLLFVGRLDIQKNVARLLDAMARVTEPVRLRLVGDGDLRQALQAQASRLGLDDRVEFVGRKHGEDLVKEYEDAELFVLPSDREGMALVALEAMAAGLPVLATAVPGNIETVQGVGVLVEPTPQALATTIDSLARDRSALAAPAAAGAARVADSRWDRVVAAIEDVYEQVGF